MALAGEARAVRRAQARREGRSSVFEAPPRAPTSRETRSKRRGAGAEGGAGGGAALGGSAGPKAAAVRAAVRGEARRGEARGARASPEPSVQPLHEAEVRGSGQDGQEPAPPPVAGLGLGLHGRAHHRVLGQRGRRPLLPAPGAAAAARPRAPPLGRPRPAAAAPRAALGDAAARRPAARPRGEAGGAALAAGVAQARAAGQPGGEREGLRLVQPRGSAERRPRRAAGRAQERAPGALRQRQLRVPHQGALLRRHPQLRAEPPHRGRPPRRHLLLRAQGGLHQLEARDDRPEPEPVGPGRALPRPPGHPPRVRAQLQHAPDLQQVLAALRQVLAPPHEDQAEEVHQVPVRARPLRAPHLRLPQQVRAGERGVLPQVRRPHAADVLQPHQPARVRQRGLQRRPQGVLRQLHPVPAGPPHRAAGALQRALAAGAPPLPPLPDRLRLRGQAGDPGPGRRAAAPAPQGG